MSTKVSICLITYNQEKYIQDCIKSILNQTYSDFELLINNDCSTDKTLEKINEIKDDRIKVFTSKYNKGINASINNLYDKAEGDYIALIGGDDMLKPFYIRKIADYLDNHSDIDVLYCGMKNVKENLTYETVPKELWEETTDEVIVNDPKAMFNTAIIHGNIALSPGMVVRKDYAKKILPLPCSLVNFQDVKMHFELLLAGARSIVFKEHMLLYRVNHSNISRQGFLSQLRADLETEYLMDSSFGKYNNVEFLESAFAKEIESTGVKPYPDTIPYFLGRMAMLSKRNARVTWGFHKIVEFLADEKNFDIANERYGLEYRDFLKFPKAVEDSIFKKSFRYKRYFNICLVGLIVCGSLMVIFGILLLVMLLY